VVADDFHEPLADIERILVLTDGKLDLMACLLRTQGYIEAMTGWI
jgi:hypothetical protein